MRHREHKPAACGIVAALLLLVLPSPVTAGAAAEPPDDAWLLAYFRQRYDSRVEIDEDGTIRNIPLADPMRVEQLHLALSRDGRHWTSLNGNRPIWEHRLRDPFVKRDPEGGWRLLATGRARTGDGPGRRAGPACLTARSRDLIRWEEVRSLHLMQEVRDHAGRPARNIWAPEWFWDDSAGEAILIWSSSFEDAGWKRSRLWFARTRDWESFTPARVLFDPPYSVIDGTLLEHDGTYFLFHKEEEFGEKTGERRAIRLATAGRLDGPYRVHEGPLNSGQLVPVITEGPSVMPDPIEPGWLLLYDFCMSNGYGISRSTNLLNWAIESPSTFPPDARHGSVAGLNAAEVEALKQAFPASDSRTPDGRGPGP